jgi:hypothetical protein
MCVEVNGATACSRRARSGLNSPLLAFLAERRVKRGREERAWAVDERRPARGRLAGVAKAENGVRESLADEAGTAVDGATG